MPESESPERAALVPIGAQTPWGAVSAVGMIQGERYYWLVDEHGDVAMMPACVVEPTL